MPRFQAEGLGRETNRRRKRVYIAYDETEARQAAEQDGMIVENMSRLPDEPATEAQLSYARDLGIPIPPKPTKKELGDLLSCHLDHDKPATERHKGFARLYRVEHTRFVGKRALFDSIFSALQAAGRERQLAAWFTYRVYRELVHGADNAPIRGPEDTTIQTIADKLATDDQVLKSIRRYAGRDLIWFGEWTAPDGSVHTGGSNRTVAYKETSRLLRDKLGSTAISNRGPVQDTGRHRERTANTGKQHYRFVAFLILLAIVLTLLLIIARS